MVVGFEQLIQYLLLSEVDLMQLDPRHLPALHYFGQFEQLRLYLHFLR
jgi:hypothetical protein